MSRIDPELLAILVCPLSKATLVQAGDQLVSTDAKTRRAYGIVEGIPDLLLEHSQTLSESEWKAAMNSAGK